MHNDRQTHWDSVYQSREETALTWFEETPEPSLSLISQAASVHDPVLDVGGGASRLVDALLTKGYDTVSVLDLSRTALKVSQDRLGAKAGSVAWHVADATDWAPPRRYEAWHDRAVFHFLTDAADRAAYVRTLLAGLAPGGTAIIAGFALDGPETCSALPVVRYSGETLSAELDARAPGCFRRTETLFHIHKTPIGRSQAFQYSVFQRL